MSAAHVNWNHLKCAASQACTCNLSCKSAAPSIYRRPFVFVASAIRYIVKWELLWFTYEIINDYWWSCCTWSRTRCCQSNLSFFLKVCTRHDSCDEWFYPKDKWDEFLSRTDWYFETKFIEDQVQKFREIPLKLLSLRKWVRVGRSTHLPKFFNTIDQTQIPTMHL